MPVTPTYPGVYIEEVPSGVHTISGVATAITAFVGYTARGLDNRATRVLGFSDFERKFGGLHASSELSYAVQHFFENGGGEAIVVRVPGPADVAAQTTFLDAVGGKDALKITALSKGSWANKVIVDVHHHKTDNKIFDLIITDTATGTVEEFYDLTTEKNKSNYVVAVLNDTASGSRMISVERPDDTAGRPGLTGTTGTAITLGDIKNDKDYTFKVSADVPTGIANVEVPFIAKNEPLPATLPAVARMLERTLTAALQKAAPGSFARVGLTPDEKGLRIQTFFPEGLDAKVTLAAGSTNDALPMLKLDAATSNVAHYLLGTTRDVGTQKKGASGSEDPTKLPTTANLIGSEAQFSGMHALLKTDLFNILCIPDATRGKLGDPTTPDNTVKPADIYDAAATLCQRRRAFLLIDPPVNVKTVDAAMAWKASLTNNKNAALYFPRVLMPDPLNDFRLRSFAPSGVVAGLFARTDTERGVWKAPAGTEATLRMVRGLATTLSDDENGVLNPLAVNCLRTFPIYGNVSWGARTLVGSDEQGSEWKYVPVRRTALYLEESLFRGTKWVVFEPNDESLWALIRLNIGAFLHGLFRLGAFQGRSAREAYFVKCDSQTTTQADINRGIVNIVVGFAPLKPAEFVIIKFQQIAGQLQT